MQVYERIRSRQRGKTSNVYSLFRTGKGFNNIILFSRMVMILKMEPMIPFSLQLVVRAL